MNELPKVPIRFIPENAEILDGFYKSVDAGQRLGGTDDSDMLDVIQVKMGESYRTAPGRTYGNVFFRREPDGSLCYEYAKNKIVDAIHEYKNGTGVDGVEAVALAVLFPDVLSHVYTGSTLAATAAIQLNLTPGEIFRLRQLVASHLDQEIAYMQSSHSV